MSKAKSLFDQIYDGAKEALQAAQKPIIRRGLKRKLRAGYDDCQVKIDNANKLIQDELAKMEGADINACLRAKGELRTLSEQQTDLAALYEEWFGEVLNTEVE